MLDKVPRKTGSSGESFNTMCSGNTSEAVGSKMYPPHHTTFSPAFLNPSSGEQTKVGGGACVL